MTENDLSVARDIGSLQSDVRTIKHDVANVSSKMDAIALQLTRVTTQQAKGLSFFAGIAFVITSCGGMLLAVWKLITSAHT